MKFPDGLAVSLMVGVSLLGLPRSGRTLALALGAFAASAVLAWLALGQPLGALPDYVRTGIAISRGYVDAMGYDAMGTNGDWEVLVVVASALALAAGGWLSLAGTPAASGRRSPSPCCSVHYFVAREMFVRYDAGHAAVISLLVVVPLAIPWQRGRARLAPRAQRARGRGLAGWASPGSRRVRSSTRRPRGAFDGQLGTVFSPASTIAAGRAYIRAVDNDPPALATRSAGTAWTSTRSRPR